jgi:hypothetical protein
MLISQKFDLKLCILCFIEQIGEKHYVPNYYLTVSLHFYPPNFSFLMEIPFWRLMPKGGGDFGRKCRVEEYIVDFMG